MFLAVLAMQVASVCAQQNDFYYVAVKSDTLAAKSMLKTKSNRQLYGKTMKCCMSMIRRILLNFIRF